MNLIGKGAFGEVFKGKLKQNESSELTVAIKVICLIKYDIYNEWFI